jgi:nucleoside-diphosphate-sugar epimerase
MRILIVGATGTIGVPVVQALEVRHEVIPASHSRSALTVDFGEAERATPLCTRGHAQPHRLRALSPRACRQLRTNPGYKPSSCSAKDPM